jgi:leader peptidase (prepilin peptidase)/N-methyltransferase
MPRGKSIILPRSHCTDCGKSLPVYLNIPILSYIILKGKCKYCGAKIHIHHLMVEIITPLVFIAMFWKYGADLTLFAKYVVMFVFLIPIFFIDLYHRLILDKLTIPMAIMGLVFALLPGSDISFLNALVTSVGMLVLFLFIAWAFEKIRGKEGLGGGDIKLFAAMATYLGVEIAFIIFFGSLIGLIVSVIASLIMSKSWKEFWANILSYQFPFGTYIVFASFFWVLWGKLFLDWYLNLIF